MAKPLHERALELSSVSLPSTLYVEICERLERHWRAETHLAQLWQDLRGPEPIRVQEVLGVTAPEEAAKRVTHTVRQQVRQPLKRAFVSDHDAPPASPRDLERLALRMSGKPLKSVHSTAAAPAAPAPATVSTSSTPPESTASTSAPLTPDTGDKLGQYFAHFPRIIALEFPEPVYDAIRAGASPLRAWREYRGTGQNDLADEVGYSATSGMVSYFERNQWRKGKGPRAEVSALMAEALRIKVAQLVPEAVKLGEPMPDYRALAAQDAALDAAEADFRGDKPHRVNLGMYGSNASRPASRASVSVVVIGLSGASLGEVKRWLARSNFSSTLSVRFVTADQAERYDLTAKYAVLCTRFVAHLATIRAKAAGCIMRPAAGAAGSVIEQLEAITEAEGIRPRDFRPNRALASASAAI
jgi:transcriptional regulator with XRE-family HTH domain